MSPWSSSGLQVLLQKDWAGHWLRTSGMFSLNLGNNSPLISFCLGQCVSFCVRLCQILFLLSGFSRWRPPLWMRNTETVFLNILNFNAIFIFYIQFIHKFQIQELINNFGIVMFLVWQVSEMFSEHSPSNHCLIWHSILFDLIIVDSCASSINLSFRSLVLHLLCLAGTGYTDNYIWFVVVL